MRIDKFLKNSRIIKRRTVAKDACEQGRISINDKPAKPGTEVKIGDEIFVQFGNGSLKVEVLALTESCRKEDAAGMYRVIE
ncbi:MAG: RNA-binding S4 domain-containing protein [Eubacterium sp.]|nr:RNA-binding S4 domain-containing protein [Candidatus Colimonas fimequi]